MATSDNNKFLRLWSEVNYNNIGFNTFNCEETIDCKTKWFPYIKGGSFRRWYPNKEYVVNYQNNGTEIKNAVMKKYPYLNNPDFVVKNTSSYFKAGITWSDVATGKFSARWVNNGFIFADAGPMLFVQDEPYVKLGYMNTPVFQMFCDLICQGLHYSTGQIPQIPYLQGVIENNKIINYVDENIKISNTDWDSFETSWDFKRHPLISVISKNRVLFDDITDIDLAECYTCWENECNERFNQLKANEEELNSIFIDIYGLQDELTPEVEDKDVTVRKADLQRDIKSLISYAVGCMFGRYSLDEEGLVLAGQPFESHFFEASAPICGTGFAGAPGTSVPIGEFYYKTDDGVKKCTYNPDKDNIIPICDEEYFSDDIVSRFCEWIKIVYGEKALETNLDFIANALGNKGDTSREVIRNYFLRDFYADHLKVYQKRPIYWLFDSGKQNGFKALIYMHRYDADTVGRVRTDYLHKAQKYVETAMQSAQYTIDNATSASEKSKATKAVTKYTKQLAEMKIYDEAIAHVANQRIEIDLDDGVKVNYAKFQGVEVAQEGKKALKIDLLAKI